jgi:cellulose synthase/poly-beta-1,6-N-acetylglucosamine synthase-like glycosyltransferase
MQTTEILFWILVFVIFYTYIGYGLLLQFVLPKKKKVTLSTLHPINFPRIAHIIAAYNEEDVIDKKIINSISLDYPKNKMKVIVVTDGSTDDTPIITERYSDVLHLHQNERRGKVSAINRAVQCIRNEYDIVVFSDANTLISKDALMHLIKHFVNPRVGGVSGEKVVLSQNEDMIHGQGEGLYWKYESWLKKLDSDYYSVAGAAGELFSIREKLFEEMPENIILDDLYLSLLICKKGFIIPYEPRATATELPSYSINDERKRRIRISAGAFQTMTKLPELLNIFLYGKFSFQYISHRVLRWAVCPVAIPLVFLLNLVIVFQGSSFYYLQLLLVQIFFYALALGGELFSDSKAGLGKLFYIPYYFVFMNISVWKGFIRFLNGTQSVNWEKAPRQRQYL